MYLETEKKKEIFAQYGKSNVDTGSTEGQIALFTFRIQHLTEHMREMRNDKFTERSLVRLVGKRRRLLDYLKSKDVLKYRELIKQLGIRNNFSILIYHRKRQLASNCLFFAINHCGALEAIMK